MTQEPKITAALIYDFDGTLAPGNMQEYDFIPLQSAAETGLHRLQM